MQVLGPLSMLMFLDLGVLSDLRESETFPGEPTYASEFAYVNRFLEDCGKLPVGKGVGSGG